MQDLQRGVPTPTRRVGFRPPSLSTLWTRCPAARRVTALDPAPPPLRPVSDAMGIFI